MAGTVVHFGNSFNWDRKEEKSLHEEGDEKKGKQKSMANAMTLFWRFSSLRITHQESLIAWSSTLELTPMLIALIPNKLEHFATYGRSCQTMARLHSVLRDRHRLMFVRLNSGLAVANETAIIEEKISPSSQR